MPKGLILSGRATGVHIFLSTGLLFKYLLRTGELLVEVTNAVFVSLSCDVIRHVFVM